jgi:hypothetical protein
MVTKRSSDIRPMALPQETQGAAGTQSQNGPELAELRELVERAAAFSSEWPQELRASVFDLAARELMQNRGRVSSPQVRKELLPARGDLMDSSFGEPMERLGSALGVEPTRLMRAVAIGEDGAITIMGRLDGESTKERQRQYCAVYAFIKEKALGALQVDAEELRTLCVAHGCYDVSNHAANLRWKDFMREVPGKGANDRRYIASKVALSQGEALLRAMMDS